MFILISGGNCKTFYKLEDILSRIGYYGFWLGWINYFPSVDIFLVPIFWREPQNFLSIQFFFVKRRSWIWKFSTQIGKSCIL